MNSCCNLEKENKNKREIVKETEIIKTKEKNNIEKYNSKDNKLKLIPKAEEYIYYMLQVIMKLPRIEKFNIGNEYKISMYEMLEKIMLISKIKDCYVLDCLNYIDAKLNTQRIYLRIMQKEKWIDEKKFNVAMGLIYEIGKILGGLVKYYGKYYKE